jgi:P-type conjugative transfer ATPase TrbB
MTPRQQREAHLHEKLRREFGPGVCNLLADPDVIEIIANPDGVVWCDRYSTGMTRTDTVLTDTQIESAIGTVAALHDHVVHAAAPRIKAELPLDGSRFQGLLRPVSPPTFVIRKHVSQVIPLSQQVQQGTVTPEQADILETAIRHRQNIVIVGATLSGKTVLADSLMDSMCMIFGPSLRLVVIEDTYELRCSAPNVVHLHTCDTVDLRTLVQDTLRLRPDRIIVGEVRGAEALDLLKALSTGHPGGVTTVHANSAKEALDRLESLIEEAGVPPNRRMIADTVNIIVMMERAGSRAWKVQDIVRCTGWDGHTYEFQQPTGGSYAEVSTNGSNRSNVAHDERNGVGSGSRYWPAVGRTDDHD